MRVFPSRPAPVARVPAICFILTILVSLPSCGKTQSAEPEPPFSSNPLVVHGSEHLGWGQALQGVSGSAYQFFAYVDGASQLLPDASCRGGADTAPVDCVALLPSMTAGTHRLRMTAALLANGSFVESSKSAPLDLLVQPGGNTVAARSAAREPLLMPQAGHPLSGLAASASTEVDVDGTHLVARTLVTVLDAPSALAATPDGRIFVVEQTGAIRIWDAGALQARPAFNITDAARGSQGALFGLALDPRFSINGAVYVAYTSQDADGRLANRILRLTEVKGTLGQPAFVFDDPTGDIPPDPPRIGFGPDRMLYATFPAAAPSRNAAAYEGKLLRLNADGSTPSDNPGYSPIVSRDDAIAIAFGWQPGTRQLWRISRDGQGRYALGQIGLAVSPAAPAMYFPQDLTPASGAFYPAKGIAALAGNLLVAGTTGQMARVVFDPLHPNVVASAQGLFAGDLGKIRDMTIGADGAVYFCATGRPGVDSPAGSLVRLGDAAADVR
jgi:glucose/arabinose dehydrogenase